MKKIPAHAKKVFEGVIFDVYHWDQEMFDGSTAVFEALKKRDTVTVLAICENKLIINYEEQPTKPPFIALPGGMCEKISSSPLDDAKRELAEETGHVSNDWMLWFEVDPLNHAKIDWKNSFYIAKQCVKAREQSLDSGEKIETVLLSFDEFLELRHDPIFRNKDILPILEKAASSLEEKQKLQTVLGIIT
jgi:ADP-ribose pyrophosphatase